MEHWDAWLAEDVFRETAHEGSTEKDSTSSTPIEEEGKKPPKSSKKTIKEATSLTSSDAPENVNVLTPKGGSRVEFANFPPGFNAKGTSGGESIFLRQMLDESIPLEKLLQIEDIPQELKDELRDWEEKFPNLTIRGKPIGKSRELQEREQLRRMVARSIVEDHLWPEMQSILSTKKTGKRPKKEEKKPKPKLLDLPNAVAHTQTILEEKEKHPIKKKKKTKLGKKIANPGAIKLPAIKKE